MAGKAVNLAALVLLALLGLASGGATQRMTTEEVVGCWNKLHHAGYLYMHGKPASEDIALTADDVERHRSFFDSDLHGFFCQTVPHYFHERVHREMAVVDKTKKRQQEEEGAQGGAKQGQRRTTEAAGATEGGADFEVPFVASAAEQMAALGLSEAEVTEEAHRYLDHMGRARRRLQTVAFLDQFDPTSLEFTKDSTLIGRGIIFGYDAYATGAENIDVCKKYDEYDANGVQTVKGGCVAERQSIFLVVYQTVSTIRTYLVEIELGPAVAALNVAWSINDVWKDSIDFTSNAYGSVRIYESFVNLKNILNNAQLIDQYLTAIASGIGGLSVQSLDVINDVLHAQANLTRRVGPIEAQLAGLRNTSLTRINSNLALIQTALNDQYARVLNKIRNVEDRVISIVSNAFLDKLTIGGTSRAGRFVPPPPAARRKLFEAWSAAKAAHEGEESAAEHDGHRGLQVTDPQYLYGYGCDGIDNDQNGRVDELGEDRFGPVIDVDSFLEASRLTWFTNVQDVFTSVQGLITGDDDCGPVGFSQPTLQGKCKNASVFVTATDRVDNLATATVPIWFDSMRPTVSFVLRPNPLALYSADPLFLKQTLSYVDIGISQLAIADNCDSKPFVQVNVYCDELDAYKGRKTQAFLVRQFSGGDLIGWRLRVRTDVAIFCKDTTLCVVPDGRVYTVVICAKDEAGWSSCARQTIGVSKSKDKIPVSQGEVFLLTHDAAFLNAVPADLTDSLSPNTFSISS